MRILLSGATGQFGRAFQDVAKDHDVVPLLHHAEAGSDAPVIELDRPETVTGLLRRGDADWLVHPAGVTNVDACERDPAYAMRINGAATGVLARACHENGIRFLYVSTDYVFDGTQGDYTEDARPAPVNAYGRSKLEGEIQAHASHPDALVCRTSVVFGPHKNNFVTWSLRELKAQRPIRVVTDQRVSPTYTYDGAIQALRLVEAGANGTYHTAGATQLSRLEMAQQAAKAFGLDAGLIRPVASDAMEWKAARPKDTTLSVRKVSALQPPMPYARALEDLKARWHP